MMTFGAAVSEYLHRAGHTRPWTRHQEEDALDGLSGWLHAGQRDVPLRSVTARMVARYAAERGLSPEELDDLQGTLAGLRLWARTASHKAQGSLNLLSSHEHEAPGLRAGRFRISPTAA